ncbi:hypothetical protein L9F63_017030, partial [Diploptera punctata]
MADSELDYSDFSDSGSDKTYDTCEGYSDYSSEENYSSDGDTDDTELGLLAIGRGRKRKRRPSMWRNNRCKARKISDMAESMANEDLRSAVVHSLHKNYISLNFEEMKVYDEHRARVLDLITNQMKMMDALFNAVFKYVYGVGSYYDNLKVSKPDEYDVNMVIKLPVDYNKIKILTDMVPAGFAKVYVRDAMRQLHYHPRWNSTYKRMENWMSNGGFLLQTKFRYWFQGVLTKAVKDLTRRRQFRFYQVWVKNSGPAMTLVVKILSDDVIINVDIVPVLHFSYPTWPSNAQLPTIRMNTPTKKTWFLVPKLKMTKDMKRNSREVPNQYPPTYGATYYNSPLPGTQIGYAQFQYPLTIQTNNDSYGLPAATNFPAYPDVANMRTEPFTQHLVENIIPRARTRNDEEQATFETSLQNVEDEYIIRSLLMRRQLTLEQRTYIDNPRSSEESMNKIREVSNSV